LQRYVGEGGTQMVGSDLYGAVNTAKKLAEHVQSATDKISDGAKLIFTGASSQARKENE